MVTIDDATWEAMLAEACASLDRLNERAIGNYAGYEHSLEIKDAGEVVIAAATQLHPPSKYSDSRQKTVNLLAWRKSDGALLKVKVKRTRQRISYSGMPVTAKSWAQAAAKSPKHLLDVSRLVAFMMIGEAYVSHVETAG